MHGDNDWRWEAKPAITIMGPNVHGAFLRILQLVRERAAMSTISLHPVSWKSARRQTRCPLAMLTIKQQEAWPQNEVNEQEAWPQSEANKQVPRAATREAQAQAAVPAAAGGHQYPQQEEEEEVGQAALGQRQHHQQQEARQAAQCPPAGSQGSRTLTYIWSHMQRRNPRVVRTWMAHATQCRRICWSSHAASRTHILSMQS